MDVDGVVLIAVKNGMMTGQTMKKKWTVDSVKTFLERTGKNIKLFLKFAPKWFFYTFVYTGYWLEGMFQRWMDKNYIGRYVHPVTKTERILFPFDNFAGGLKNEARISLCIPDKLECANPIQTTLDMLDHEVLHQVLVERINRKADEGLDEIQDGDVSLLLSAGQVKVSYKMFWKWKDFKTKKLLELVKETKNI